MATATHTTDSAAFITADFSKLKTQNLFAAGHKENMEPHEAMVAEMISLSTFAETNEDWFEWHHYSEDGIPDGSLKSIQDIARLYYLVVAVIGMNDWELVLVMDSFADDPDYFAPGTAPGNALKEIRKILPYWDIEYKLRVESSYNDAAIARLHGAG